MSAQPGPTLLDGDAYEALPDARHAPDPDPEPDLWAEVLLTTTFRADTSEFVAVIDAEMRHLDEVLAAQRRRSSSPPYDQLAVPVAPDPFDPPIAHVEGVPAPGDNPKPDDPLGPRTLRRWQREHLRSHRRLWVALVILVALVASVVVVVVVNW